MKQFCKISFILGGIFGVYLAHAAPSPAGKIKLMKGGVFIVDATSKVVADPEGKRGRSTKVGSPFYVGETVQTKTDGRVKLEFIEGNNEVVLGPDTSLTIEKASTAEKQKKGTDLNLARGEVRSDVKTKYSGQDGESFQVKTPNAVAGIRGTIVYARYDARNAKSDFACLKGSFEVKSSGSNSPVVVNAGMSTSAVKDAGAQAPRPLSANPDMQKAAESLGGNSDSASKDKASDGQSSASAKPAAAPESKEKADAPLGRETVVTKKDEGGRGPASVDGGINAGAPAGEPQIMGSAGGGSESKSGANTKTGFDNPGAVDPGKVLNNATNTASNTTTAVNQNLNQVGKVKIVIQ